MIFLLVAGTLDGCSGITPIFSFNIYFILFYSFTKARLSLTPAH
jgi:hypothetical protein